MASSAVKRSENLPNELFVHSSTCLFRPALRFFSDPVHISSVEMFGLG